MLIRIPKSWRIPEREATPEHLYMNRRGFLKDLGMAGAWTLGILSGCIETDADSPKVKPLSDRPLTEAERAIYPAQRNPTFVLDRPLTEEGVAARYNNFYEFSREKEDVWKKVERFVTRRSPPPMVSGNGEDDRHGRAP